MHISCPRKKRALCKHPLRTLLAICVSHSSLDVLIAAFASPYFGNAESAVILQSNPVP